MAKPAPDAEIVAQLAGWHDWLVAVQGQTVWGETALETLRRVVPHLLLAIEIAGAGEPEAVADLVRPPSEG